MTEGGLSLRMPNYSLVSPPSNIRAKSLKAEKKYLKVKNDLKVRSKVKPEKTRFENEKIIVLNLKTKNLQLKKTRIQISKYV